MSSIRLVWPFLALEEVQRADTAARLGLTQEQFDNPDTRVSQKLLSQLLRDTIARTGERDLGLLAARHVDSLHLGITDYIARSVPTLAAAISMMERYLPLLGEGVRFAIERKGRRVFARLAFDPELEMHESAYEFALATWVLWTRRIPGLAGFAPRSVHFMHPRPASIRRHQKLFGCPVHFSAEAAMLVISAGALEEPLSTADPVLGSLLERQADAMLECLPCSDALTERVRVEPASRELAGRGLSLPGGSTRPALPRVISSRRGVIRLFDAREITRFWSFEKYTLFSVQGEEHMSDEPLSALEARLAAHGFFRVHRAELVRMDAVRALRVQHGVYDVELSDGQHAKVSRRSLAAVKGALGLTP